MEILKWSVIILAVIGGLFGGFLLYSTLNDYNPPEVLKLDVHGTPTYNDSPKKLTVLTWNIGYGGLDSEMDFFMDGGKSVKTTEKKTLENMKAILNFVKNWKDDVDVFFFQEVDIDSDRSYHMNEYDMLKNTLTGFASVFAYNYRVDFVPVPPTSPLGKVRSGVAVFSKYSFSTAKRYSLPGEYPWPTKIFQLDRCMIVIRFPAENGKEWVLINTHNSAYDEDGSLRKKQLSFIKNFALKEYEKGNYVVIGGDWNAVLPLEYSYTYEEATPTFYVPIPENWTPEGWKWVAGNDVPTNRSLAAPYKKGYTYVTTIDGFLVSPNLQIVKYETIDLDFKYSDHNPVVATFEILK